METVQRKKITDCKFNKSWLAPDGDTVNYYLVSLEGEAVAYTLGTKDQNATNDWLKIGETLTFEIKDVLKRKISKINPEYVANPTTLTKSPTSAYDAGVGAMVGNAITNAVNMVIAGKANVDELEVIAESICSISINLKNKFAR